MGASSGGNWWRVPLIVSVIALAFGWGRPAAAQRVTGLDISAWQGNISQTTWNNIHNVENRQFVFMRSSRGGTTGYYNQSNRDNDNPPGQNTLSQRYDDPYFIQNINRATTAGMYAGPYHFSRPDIIASTLNSNGIPNSGADEANHFIQMAGPWMRPGYLLPVHDLEAGQSERTSAELSAFAVDFSDRIHDVMGFRPIVYSSQNYANYIDSTVPPVYPNLWIARWPQGSGVQFTGNLQTDNPPPSPSTANVYGQWNPNHTVANPYPDGHPWKFWQYSSGERLQSYNNGGSNLDGDVANGGLEFLKDHLVPALWLNDASGDWNTLSSWNSGQTPVLPVPGAGQVSPVGTLTLPTPRLPGAAGSGVTSGQYDTVILDRPNSNIVVTHSAGTHNVRKLLVRETLNITGGSLSATYNPASWDSPIASSLPVSAQFSGPVTLGGTGSFSAHTLQVDAGQLFTISGGSLTLDTINLAGTMSIADPTFTDVANVRLSAGAALNLAYSGAPDTVNALYFDGVPQAPGTWGAVGSGAQYTSPLITGTGLLQVAAIVEPPSGPGNVLDDFEVNEGHFGWAYNFSPASQTFGLSPATTIDRDTTEHQGEGVASQLLNLVSDGSASWQIRHNSGIGQAANPSGNVPLVGDGNVGFWLKTDDSGITVRIGIDDPVGGNTALERGIAVEVIADNAWHLYQWDFDDDTHWEAFAGGANGLIDAALGTVTIDSIWFAGSGSAQVFLDTVSHNPLGLLAAAPVPGDYNGDGTVSAADYTAWRSAFGQSVTPYTSADGNGDGVVDQGDYVLWRKQMALSGSGAALDTGAVPEPAGLLLAAVAVAFGQFIGRRGRRALRIA